MFTDLFWLPLPCYVARDKQQTPIREFAVSNVLMESNAVNLTSCRTAATNLLHHLNDK